MTVLGPGSHNNRKASQGSLTEMRRVWQRLSNSSSIWEHWNPSLEELNGKSYADLENPFLNNIPVHFYF